MRVLMMSTSYPRGASDWRGIFIRHLINALARIDELQLSLWAPPGELPATVTSITRPDQAVWLSKLMQAGGISHLMRSGRLSAVLAPAKLLRLLRAGYLRHTTADIYHINWLQCALPLPDNRVPALITVLGNDLKLLRLPLMRSLLRRVMRRRRVAICPIAEWMHAPLEAAFGDLATIVPVNFGIDATWYAIERKPSLEKPVWIAVTRLAANKLGPLFDWSEPLFRNHDRELHLFGPMQEQIDVPNWVSYHGPATPTQLATEWFPRACGLITLSRHAEGRPQVMLEAMAAGLPIIASRMPAHSTIVVDGKTGGLCDSAETYGEALLALEEGQVNQRLGTAARQWAEQEIGTWDDCANRYIRIYRQLLADEADG